MKNVSGGDYTQLKTKLVNRKNSKETTQKASLRVKKM